MFPPPSFFLFWPKAQPLLTDDETSFRPRPNSSHCPCTPPLAARKKRGFRDWLARENELTMTQSTAATLSDDPPYWPTAKKLRPFSPTPDLRFVDIEVCLRQIKQLKEVLMTMGNDLNSSRLMCGVCDVSLVKMSAERTVDEALLCREVECFFTKEISKTNEKISHARQKLSAACSRASPMPPGLRPLIKKLTDKKRSLATCIRKSRDCLFLEDDLMKKLSEDVKAAADRKGWMGDLLSDIYHGRRPLKMNLDKLPSVFENHTLAATAPVVFAMHHSERGVFDQFCCKVIAHELEKMFKESSRDFMKLEGTLLGVAECVRRTSEKHSRKREELQRTEDQLQAAIQERDRVRREEDEKKAETRCNIAEISLLRKRHDQLHAALVTFRSLQVCPAYPPSPIRSTPTTRCSPGSSIMD
eukprot:GEMP01013543.1.p1 GENE.GEMP01013543.1~~GEMP01013543.1.p1  ORF type:complete len:415 (+),score=64.09 GEMP01013543.1:129-1373(+)